MTTPRRGGGSRHRLLGSGSRQLLDFEPKFFQGETVVTAASRGRVHGELESLRRQYRHSGGRGAAPHLWIVCHDVAMDRAVERIRTLESALVLRRPPTELLADRREDQPYSALEYAIQELGVTDLFLCGHSMCSLVTAEEREVPRQGASSPVCSMLQRVRHRERLNRRLKRKLVEQLAAAFQLPSVQSAAVSRRLAVHGIFYLVESDVFTRYDRDLEHFEAIVESESLQRDG